MNRGMANIALTRLYTGRLLGARANQTGNNAAEKAEVVDNLEEKKAGALVKNFLDYPDDDRNGQTVTNKVEEFANKAETSWSAADPAGLEENFRQRVGVGVVGNRSGYGGGKITQFFGKCSGIGIAG